MLSTLFTHIDWNRVRCLGFDMDGTLYDEFEFIRQVYPACLAANSGLLRKGSLPHATRSILSRWLEKGSSYSFLFEEIFDQYGGKPSDKALFIQCCLAFYRRFKPDLSAALSFRSQWILEEAGARWPLFLVTDGRPLLQRAKFESLGLGRYFPEERRVFTGDLPPEAHKPSPAACLALRLPFKSGEIVYFGDRQVDREFAANSGFQFAWVANMFNLENKPITEAS